MRALLVRTAALAVAMAAVSCSDADSATPAPAATSAVPTTVVVETTTTSSPVAMDVDPGLDWSSTTAAEAGFDQGRLDAIAARAEAGGSNCLLVARDGRLVSEWYWNGATAEAPQEVYSVTKSITSVLIGIAQDDGDLSVDDAMSDYFPAWGDTASAGVTVRNVLSNDSGRHWDLGTDYGRMAAQADDKTAFAAGLGQDAEPGTVWAYNNSAIQTLSGVLATATGESAGEFATEQLFAPIGMTHSAMTTDRSGGTLTFMGLQSTCRDLARFGHLLLRNGTWAGDEIVSADYVEAATGASSQSLNAAYGYLFWVNRTGRIGSPMQATTGATGGDVADGQLVPGAPEDMFWALGLGNQIVQVDPGSGTVVVRLGPQRAPAGAAPFATKDAAEVVTTALTGP